MSDSSTPSAGSSSALLGWEHLMPDSGELVHRQVHPRFFDQGIISDEAFVARADEDRKLSATRRDKVTAQDARKHYMEVLNLSSAGAAELTVGEVENESSRCVDDSADPNNTLPPGHCYIDFRGMSKNGRKDVREALAEIATDRGIVT